MNRFVLPVLVAAVVLATGCGDSGPAESNGSSQSSSTTAQTLVTSPVLPPALPRLLEEWDTGYIELDGEELLVAIADTPQQRRQGLMNVDDLLDLDGMLFVLDSDSTGGFWMKDTLLPLDIAFFDGEGLFVDGFAMEPCTTGTCPTYTPSGSYRFALEMEAGTMPENPQVLVARTR